MSLPTRREKSIRVETTLLSLLIFFLFALGGLLFAVPSFAIHQAFSSCHNEEEDIADESTLLELMLCRILGGVLIALAFSSAIVLYGSRLDDGSSSTVSCRISLLTQALAGLLFVLAGLCNDRGLYAHEDNGYESLCTRIQLKWVLGIGASYLVITCIGLMASHWPSVTESPSWTESEADDSEEGSTSSNLFCCSQRCSRMSQNDLEEPLLPQPDDEGPPPLQDGDNVRATSPDSGSTPETSRLRGTRRLIRLAAPQMFYLYLGCAVLLVRLPFSLSIPHFVSTTLGALARGDYAGARTEVLLLFCLGTIDAALDFWCVFLFGYAKERIVRGVRIDTFTSILRQEVCFFDRHTSGELSSRLTSDCGEMAGDLTWFFRFSIESVVRIFGITAYMLIRSPLLGGCALCIVPIVAVINKQYGDWLRKNAIAVQTALAEANSVAQEAFACIRTVISFAAEDLEQQKYAAKIDRQYDLNIRQLYMSGIYFMAVSTFLINTCVQAALLLVGTALIEHGKLTPEVLLAFMLYQGQLQNETLNLFNSYSSLVKSSGAGDKVFALLDRKPPPPGTGSPNVVAYSDTDDFAQIVPTADDASGDCENDKTNGDTAKAHSSVELSQVDYVYPSRPLHKVLDSFDLVIPAGSTQALVGPSGGGKSTVIGLLQRFFDPTGGQITIDGEDLCGIDIKSHRRRIGAVTQDPVLFSGTILSNITYGSPSASREEAIVAAQLANAHSFIVSFPEGYDTQVGERGIQLSGGQRQRLCIARAIVKKPSLLLLDEATSALDAESEHVVQVALDRLLQNNRGLTTVIVAHRLRTVRNADRIAFLQDGRVVEQGSHEELMQISGGHYQRMVHRADKHGHLPDS